MNNASAKDTRGYPLRRPRARTINNPNYTPIGRGNSSKSQRAEDHYEVLIKDLEGREQRMNSVLIAAGAISLSLIRWIMINFRYLHAIQQVESYQPEWLYATVHSHVSQHKPHSVLGWQAPLPSISSIPFLALDLSLLVFSLCAASFAILGKWRIHDHRRELVVQRYGRGNPLNDSRILDPKWNEFMQGWYTYAIAEPMYRAFQVALLIFLLGLLDVLVISLGVTVFAPILICGVLYTLGVIGRTPVLL
ncbi:hypothetical protein BJV74DRAFT_868778 [Russula compacta]|nr:hypothetical protein BJV74DRAFT_868778 [Russula compacta]